MEESKLNELLAQEYIHIQTVIDAFDEKALTIKAWSISFSLTALGVSYAIKTPAILVIASLSALLFWLLEGYWKTFQYMHYQRSGEIEKHFNCSKPIKAPMQIGSVWFSQWEKHRKKRYFKVLLFPHVALPHLAVAIFGILLFILHLLDIVKVN